MEKAAQLRRSGGPFQMQRYYRAHYTTPECCRYPHRFAFAHRAEQNHNLAEFVRVSHGSQAADGRMGTKSGVLWRAIHEHYPSAVIRHIFRSVELGQLSAKRPGLLEALDYARRYSGSSCSA